jgi:hypothetical protein
VTSRAGQWLGIGSDLSSAYSGSAMILGVLVVMISQEDYEAPEVTDYHLSAA